MSIADFLIKLVQRNGEGDEIAVAAQAALEARRTVRAQTSAGRVVEDTEPKRGKPRKKRKMRLLPQA